MKFPEKTLKFNLISFLKICFYLIGLGSLITLLNEGVAWIVIIGIIFLAVFEASSMYYAYKNKGKPKGKEEQKK